MSEVTSNWLDYSYESVTGSKTVNFTLTAPKDSVNVNVFKLNMYTKGTDEYYIRQQAESFKSHKHDFHMPE